MVAPQVDFEHACLQFVAAWAAETLAEFLLRAAWCCAAALLHARAAAADAPHTATSISVSDLEACLPSLQTKQKSGSKLSLHHRRGTTLGDVRHVLCILQQQRLLLPHHAAGPAAARGEPPQPPAAAALRPPRPQQRHPEQPRPQRPRAAPAAAPAACQARQCQPPARCPSPSGPPWGQLPQGPPQSAPAQHPWTAVSRPWHRGWQQPAG